MVLTFDELRIPIPGGHTVKSPGSAYGMICLPAVPCEGDSIVDLPLSVVTYHQAAMPAAVAILAATKIAM